MRMQIQSERSLGIAQIFISLKRAMPFLSNSAFLIASTISGSFFGYLFWAIAARSLSQEQVGFGAAYISTLTFLAAIAEMGLGTTLIHFAPSLEAKKEDFIHSVILSQLVSILIVTAAFLLGVSLWSTELGELSRSNTSMMIFALSTTFFSLVQLFDKLFIAFQATYYLFARNILANILRLAFILTAGRVLGATGLLLAVGLGAAFTLLLSVLLFAPRTLPGYRPRLRLDWTTLKDKLAYSLGNHISILLWNAPPLLYPLVIVAILGARDNALFYVAWMIANLLFVLPAAFSTTAFAMAANHGISGDRAYWRICAYTLLGLVPLSLILLASSHWILQVFGGEYLVTAPGLMKYLILSIFPYTVNTFVIVFFRIREENKNLVFISASISLMSLVFIIAFGKFFSLQGVGIGWFLAQTAGMLLAIWILWRNRRLSGRGGSAEGYEQH